MSGGGASNFFVYSLLRARDWQHRPQLDDVCRWWRGGGRGVLALVGMGGAGKTAIAERFLRVLPGGLPTDPDVPKDGSLPTPHGVFVFSFYDAPNPEAFFESLQMWLEHSPRVQTVLSLGQMFFLLQQTPGLMVLDGVEKVQEDGVRGLLGRLASPKLREFLDRIAAGYFPELSVLVTSRFPLADLRDARPQFFRSLPIDEIELPAGIRLLRARGVRGTDLQLAPIVDACGRHALTVDFAGGYIAEFGGGDPATPVDFDMDSARLRQRLDDEPDEARRHVLKQGHRFARLAERYRDAMLGGTSDRGDGDAAALALLQRICLFRLGVDAETLANIFTGEKAVPVSGPALAGLSRQQLQKKLDWLVRMRIVERTLRPSTRHSPALDSRPSTLNSRPSTLDSRPSTLYSIHPAVRDGFLSGIADEALRENHEAVRQGLEVSLGNSPGKNPSDPVTLDLLEEIVHHTLQSGHVREAWDIYWNRIGHYRNLLWRLGAYERGERICRAFAGGHGIGFQPVIVPHSDRQDADPTALPFQSLPEADQANFISEWALYLSELGRLAAAARGYERSISLSQAAANWVRASEFSGDAADAWLLSGRLTAGQATAAEALRLAELADDAYMRTHSHAYRAHAYALRGEVPAALADFRAALKSQHKAEGDNDQPLYSLRGIQHTRLLARLGRREEATRLTEANEDACVEFAGPVHMYFGRCRLILSDLHRQSGDLAQAETLLASAHNWAVARDAKEVLCWSALVQARIVLARLGERHGASRRPDPGPTPRAEPDPRLAPCGSHLADGLKIACDCGFGLYHIDLLLERARLHLLSGEPQAALDDLRTALDDGVHANEQTGQPELLAATHAECGYAWAIAEGLQLRAEALLLQAAQTLGQSTFVPAHRSALPAAVRDLLTQAESCLTQALACWHPLHDPEPERPDQNFRLDGKEYNYRAEEAHRILDDLGRGILRRHELRRQPPPAPPKPIPERKRPMTFDVFLSHNSKDKPMVRQLAENLRQRGVKVWLDEWELIPGRPWQQALEEIVDTAKSAAVLVGKDGLGPWEETEMRALLDQFVRRRLPVIPVLLPDAPQTPELPLFLRALTYVDLRSGLTDAALDRLVWGITGRRPEELPPSTIITSIEFTLDRPLSEFNEMAFRAAFQRVTGIDARLVRIASIRSGSTMVRVEAAPEILAQVVKVFQKSQDALHRFAQLTGLTQVRWTIDGATYEFIVSRPATHSVVSRDSAIGQRRFAVAFSFPGEHRACVEQIADALAAAITKARVFYDRYYEAELSRPNLDTYLQKIYHDDSELVVVVLCKEYDEKEWCGLEFRAIRDLIKKRRDDEIMFVRLADGDVKGVFGIDGYVDAKNRPATEIAQVIRDRLALLQSQNPLADSPAPDRRTPVSQVSSAPRNVHVAPTRLRHTAEKLIGREDDLKRLDADWDNPHRNVVVVRAFGGMGKTSLVAAWMAKLAAENWRGAERVFDWTFYSQGAGEHRQASSDTFIKAALEFFGEAAMAASPASPWDKGAKLAEQVAARRTLLVLDGLEPLQHPPGPLEGRLRDPAIEALLKGLARQNPGLCVVTTREKVTDLAPHFGRTADDFELLRLTDAAGAALLHACGARRAGPRELLPDDAELQAASRELRGHGLTLLLVGQYLRLVEGGDIRRRDTLRLAEAEREYQLDATRPYGHAFKAMAAYERWFAGAGESGSRQLAALRLLGLFDRPASAGCLDALRSEPAIAGLTEPLVGLSEREWRLVLGRLSDINLLTVQADGGVDAHPLLREYFAWQLREGNAEGFREAHRRLYEHLCSTTPDKPQPTLDDLQPLYQAVTHGCLAGAYVPSFRDVLARRILRWTRGMKERFLATETLGLWSQTSLVLRLFFAPTWQPHDQKSWLVQGETDADQELMGLLYSMTSMCFRTRCEFGEAIRVAEAGYKLFSTSAPAVACRLARMLNQTCLATGDLRKAEFHARNALSHPSSTVKEISDTHARLAETLHHLGQYMDSQIEFENAINLRNPLTDFSGYEYGDFLLTLAGEEFKHGHFAEGNEYLNQVETQAEPLDSESNSKYPQRQALGKLLKARTRMLRARHERDVTKTSELRGDALILLSDEGGAISLQRKADQRQHLPLMLLARAEVCIEMGQLDEARHRLIEVEDLANPFPSALNRHMADADRIPILEAWEPHADTMKLHLTDCYLVCSRVHRLAGDAAKENDSLRAAGKLIDLCGYKRRAKDLPR